MKQSKYEKAAAQAPGPPLSSPGLGQGKGPAGHDRLRRARRRRQGRHDPRADRAGEPARLPGRGAAGAVGSREVAGLHPALHAAFSRGGRSRDLRSQLVQPRRRRDRHGLLLGEGARPLPRALPADREVPHRGRHHSHQALARGQQRRAEEALRGTHRRSGAAVEAQSDGPAVANPLVRLLARARPDAGEDRHAHLAVAPRAIRRQEDRAPERDRAHPVAAFRTRRFRARRSRCRRVRTRASTTTRSRSRGGSGFTSGTEVSE